MPPIVAGDRNHEGGDTVRTRDDKGDREGHEPYTVRARPTDDLGATRDHWGSRALNAREPQEHIGNEGSSQTSSPPSINLLLGGPPHYDYDLRDTIPTRVTRDPVTIRQRTRSKADIPCLSPRPHILIDLPSEGRQFVSTFGHGDPWNYPSSPSPQRRLGGLAVVAPWKWPCHDHTANKPRGRFGRAGRGSRRTPHRRAHGHSREKREAGCSQTHPRRRRTTRTTTGPRKGPSRPGSAAAARTTHPGKSRPTQPARLPNPIPNRRRRER